MKGTTHGVMDRVMDDRPASGRRFRARAMAGLSLAALTLGLGACDALGGEDPASSPPSPTAAPPMDPESVASSESTPVDPSWLCRPGEEEPPVRATEPGLLTPEVVSAEGSTITVSGALDLGEDATYQGFVPEGVLLPAHPENRGIPAPGYDVELGQDGAPVPPMVVRERVEIAGEGEAPSAATARLTLGTCDDAPLPEGQFLLRLSGGGVDGPGRGDDDAGWRASGDVLVDVVDGELRAVPGVATAPSGEAPVDLSPLHCRATLEPLGDGNGMTVTAKDPTTRVSTGYDEDELGSSVTAQVTATSPDLGTVALLQGIVITNPETGTVVAGARNTPTISLQWMAEDGATRAERTWTTHGACGADSLSPGDYQAHAFAVSVDEEGATQLVLSDPWDLEVVEAEPES